MPSVLELHSLRRPQFPSRVALEVKTLECSINYSRPASASLPQLAPMAATAVVPAHQTLLFFGGIPSDTPRARTLLYVAATLRFSFSAITAALVSAGRRSLGGLDARGSLEGTVGFLRAPTASRLPHPVLLFAAASAAPFPSK